MNFQQTQSSALSVGWRLSGHRKALRGARIAVDDSMIQRGDYTVESGTVAMHSFFSQRQSPTAVFCANDRMAIGVARALKVVGMRVSTDVPIVGFDDEDVAEIHDPPRTTVHFPDHGVS